jgi:hypothetical protein
MQSRPRVVSALLCGLTNGAADKRSADCAGLRAALYLPRAPLRSGVGRIQCGTISSDREDEVTMKPDSSKRTPEAHLRSSIDRLDPKNRKLMRSVRAAVRKRFPTLNELAYDYATSFVIGYSPTERGIDAIVSIAARADGVRLYFTQGVRLPDPKGLLLGSGRQSRFVRVEAASQLAHPDVEALVAVAIEQASIPVTSKRRGTLIIKSVGATQRPRRKLTK